MDSRDTSGNQSLFADESGNLDEERSESESLSEVVDDSNSSLNQSSIFRDSTSEQNITQEMSSPEKLNNTSNIKDTTTNDSPITFAHRKINKIIDSSTSSEGEDDDNDVIDVSSGEDFTPITPKRQTTLPELFNKQLGPVSIDSIKPEQGPSANSVKVSKTDYDEQKAKVDTLQTEYTKVKNLLRTINLPALPDKGQMLYRRQENLKEAVLVAEKKLKNMVVDENLISAVKQLKNVPWEDLEVMSESVQPKTFGQQAMATLNAQKTMTMESLQQLHSSLMGCPTEDTLAEAPKGLKVELMPHQKHALAWLLWREGQKPSGGILADDMGLGKTLTMISLLLKSKQLSRQSDSDDSDEENRHERNVKPKGGTLVVCPASLLNQWENEVQKHCKRYTISVVIYHGSRRETKAKILAQHDMVITTYTICSKEYENASALYGVRWRRIILDEAHQIRNHKAKSSIAACKLHGESRWALTGTPVHNKELDMYSLLKFLKCRPFDDLAVWKRWIATKNTGGQDRIQTIISSIMLRRTKIGLQEKGALQTLPEKHLETIEISLQAEEKTIYQKILIFSRTLFAQYLHQQVDKQSEYMTLGKYSKLASDTNNAYYQMHQKLVKLNRVKEVKSHEILVLLLRLRQMCCHPSLIVKMLHGDQLLDDEDIAGHEEFNILEEMKKLNLEDGARTDQIPTTSEKDTEIEGFQTPLKDLLNPENPIFSEKRESTKFRSVLKLLKEKILPTNEKTVIVSQWTGLLRLLSLHLEEANIPFGQLDGSIPVPKRMNIVDTFNSENHPTKVLLLSLTAGGVGLNLIGGNHMILLDLHWNPQLEMQAHDRIYRVGQRKKVHVYKFMTTDTIEERIKALQESKLNLATSMLTGSQTQNTKLSLQDLRMLFNM